MINTILQDEETKELDKNIARDVAVRITQLRQQKNYTMAKLADITGITRSMISQVEKGEALPSLQTLSRIAEALGITLSSFFDMDSSINRENDIIVRAGTNKRINMPGNDVWYNILTPSRTTPMEFLLVNFPPGNEEGTLFQHEGIEYFYVLEGELIISIDNVSYTIYAGDSGSFDSSLPHYTRNNTDKPAKLIIVASEL
jgi:Predicted transcriptional regulators